MKDAFVSYAREDLPFVRELVGRLEARDLEVWVDLEGIHAGEEWDDRIRAGIEGSDAFVFVVSPHSAASAACAREVEHAVAGNKRILPVVLEEPSAELPPAIASHQWLFFDEDRERATEELVRAVTVDPAFVREHTRLLVRSTEWERRGRDPGYLLRGSDLERAEGWLAEAGSYQEPRPTRVQSEFVVAGRRAATRRSRILTASVTGGLVVALVLAGIAWVQRQSAQERARVALSRQLAAQATAVEADGDGDLGLLLALAGHRESPTAEALGSLLTLLTLDPPLDRYLHGLELEVTSLVFGPDGRWLAAGGCEVVSELDLCERYAVRVWSMPSGEELPPLRTGQTSSLRLAVSPDGSTLAVGSGDASVQLWSTAGWERRATLTTGRAAVRGLAFSPDGRWLMAAAARGLTGWDAETGRTMPSLPPSSRDVHDLAFHPDGERLATAHDDGTVRLWRVTERGLDGESGPADVWAGHRGRVDALAFAPDGTRMVSGGWDDRVLLWDLDDGGDPQILLEGRDVSEVAFDATGRRVLATVRVGEEDGEILLLDTATGRPSGRFPGTGRPAVERLGGGGRVAFASGDGTVAVRRLDSGPPLGRPLAEDVGAWPTVLAGGPLVGGGRGVTVSDPETGDTLWRVDGPADRVAASADGSTVAALSGDRVRAWRLEPSAGAFSGTALLGPGLRDPSGTLYALALGPTGRYLAVGGASDSVRIYDLESGGAPVTTFGTAGDVYGLAFHPIRRTLFSGSEDGSVVEWTLDGRTARGRFLGAHTPREDGLTAFALDREGRVLLTSGLEHTVLWDVEEGAPYGPAFPGAAGVFRPDGRLVAVLVDDRIVLVDTASRQPVARSLGRHDPLGSLAWGGNGRWLVSAGSEEDRVWEMAVEAWRARACVVAGRELTREEAGLYLGRPREPLCPDAPSPRSIPEDAFALFHRGDRLLARGRTGEGRRVLAAAAREVAGGEDADLAGRICWKGVTGGAPEAVMPACEHAVALAPDEAGYRDSRGVGRLLLGDVVGAGRDFRAYVDAYGDQGGSRGRRAAERLGWIQALERGEDPLDEVTLRALREDRF